MQSLLHLLTLALLSGVSAKVVWNFERECGHFFADKKSPTVFSGLKYKQICQTLNGVSYYATLYDTKNRIPVYSAYTFEGRKNCTRKSSWFIEPQLDDSGDENMGPEGSVPIERRGQNQSLDEDYVNSRYDRGHLFPVYHVKTQSCADATFTLTNAAPQNHSFNRGQWRDLERNLADNHFKDCQKEGYSVFIVTGVVPGTGKTLKNRVNVPSHFWTAFCCLDQNNKCKNSGGFIGENRDIPPYYIHSLAVTKLETELEELYGNSPFTLFHRSRKRPRTQSNYCLKRNPYGETVCQNERNAQCSVRLREKRTFNGCPKKISLHLFFVFASSIFFYIFLF